MDRFVGIAALIVSLALLWSGRKRVEFSSFLTTVLSVLELLGLGIAVVSLGWWGLVVLGAVNVLAVLIWSVVLASRVETKLVYAGIQVGESKETMKALAKRLAGQEGLQAIGPEQRAELISLLADRNRSILEIEEMASPIGMLKSIHKVPLDWLAKSFDTILRGAGEPATKAEQSAEIIHGTAINAAASFTEIVDAFVTFYTEDAPEPQPA